MSGHLSTRQVEQRVTRLLERGTVFEYVPGPHPYVWIGSKDGRFIDAIDVRELRRFLAEGRANA